MKIKTVVNGSSIEESPLTVIFVSERKKIITGLLKKIDVESGKRLSKIISEEEFNGKRGDSLLFNISLKKEDRKILLVGLGEENKIEIDTFRRAAGITYSKASERKVKEAALIILPELSKLINPYQIGKAIAEGFYLSSFEFNLQSKKEDKKKLDSITICVDTEDLKKKVKAGVSDGQKICEEVNYIREMVAMPANMMTPSTVAKKAKEIARRTGLKCKIISSKEAEKLGMHSFISVTKGSREEAKLIVLEYIPPSRSKSPCIVLIGKGITFDSGGISLKPSKGMHQMKYDMGGGAAVLGAIAAAAKIKLPIRILSIIPATENMPGGSATKPGDVVKSLSGKTIEIQNTDAEGRLVLADALTYAKKFNPDAIVDIATLTGACIVALGNCAMGVMGNNEKLIEIIKEASSLSYERVWELPLWDDYKEDITSDIADIKNIGSGSAGTIIGGIFLKEFVDEKTPWAHLDIAGTCWNEKKHDYFQKGPTGSGVRLMVEMMKIIAKKKRIS